MRPLLVVVLVLTAQLSGCATDEGGGEAPSSMLVPHYVLTGFAGGEGTMGATSSGALFMAADDLVIRSTDGGLTWESVHAFGLEAFGSPVDPISNNDPMMWVDTITDRVYHAPMWPALTCVQLAWSDDEGASWFERPFQCNQLPTMDAQKLASGVRGPEPNAFDTGAHPTVLYLCFGAISAETQVNCVVSFDGGLTFPLLRTVASGEDCPEGTGHPVVTEGGVALVPAAEGCPHPILGVSYDSGASWATVELPGDQDFGLEPSVDVDAAGHVYYAFIGADLLPHLDVGHVDQVLDGGAWREVALPLGDLGAGVFPIVLAGDEGRIALSFIGTRDAVEDPSDAPAETRWHLFVLTGEDVGEGAPRWTLHQVTPDEDPVQIGCVWLRGFVVDPTDPRSPFSECRNLLDFTDMTLAPDGTAYVAYTEGCTEGCAGRADARPEDSRDGEAAIAWLEGLVLRTPE